MTPHPSRHRHDLPDPRPPARGPTHAEPVPLAAAAQDALHAIYRRRGDGRFVHLASAPLIVGTVWCGLIVPDRRIALDLEQFFAQPYHCQFCLAAYEAAHCEAQP